MYTEEIIRFEVRNGVVYKKVHAECKSADTPPTANIINGSDLIVMDAGKIQFFDEDTTAWIDWEEA